MKNISRNFLSIAAIVTMSTWGLAEEHQGLNPAELIQATTAAMEVFKAANPDHMVHMSGFKTWKSGSDAKVKFYVAHDAMSMEYNYLCLKQENQIHCTVL